MSCFVMYGIVDDSVFVLLLIMSYIFISDLPPTTRVRSAGANMSFCSRYLPAVSHGSTQHGHTTAISLYASASPK